MRLHAGGTLEISNRSLLVLLIAAVALVFAAVWLNLRPPPPVVEETDLAPSIVELPPEVYRIGSSSFKPSGPIKVEAAEGTLVQLDCDGFKMSRTAKRGTTTFEDVPIGGCSLTLGEDDVTPFQPVFPGDTIHCTINPDNNATSCAGSLAEKHAAVVVAWSWGTGRLKVDGQEVGELPIDSLHLKVGRHQIEFQGERARSTWNLEVQPDERIELFFHAPTREAMDSMRRPESAVMMPPAP